MPPIVSTIDIARPPDEVFAYVTDPSRFAEWQPDVVGVSLAGARPPGVGARFATTRRVGGAERTMTQEVTEVDAPRRWAAQGVDGPVRPNATVTVEPLDGGARSRVTVALDFEGHGVGKPLVPLIRRQYLKASPVSFRNLKERLERGASPGRQTPGRY